MQSTISFPNLGGGLTFGIDRVAFSFNLFGNQIDIYWYGILIALGMLLAVLYAMRNSKRLGVDSDRLLDVALGGIIGGIIGARLYYVLFNLSEFTTIGSVFNIKEGGLAIYGGLIGGLLVGGLISKWRKVPFLSVCDLASVGFLIGQSIGRWGNFFNQEAFGTNTSLPWGMTGDRIASYLRVNTKWLAERGVEVDFTQPVHPCFLYESLWCLIGVILLHQLSKRRKYQGQVFLGYIAWYGAGRFFIEGLRTDSLYIGASNIRVSQLLSGLAVLAAVVIHFVIISKLKDQEGDDPDYVPVFGTVEQGGSLEDLRLEAAKQRALVSSLNEEAQSLRELAAELEKQAASDADDTEDAAAEKEADLSVQEQPQETPEELIQKAQAAEAKAEEAAREAVRLEKQAAKAQRQREAASLVAKASDLEKQAEELKQTAKALRESGQEGNEEKAQEAENQADQLEKEAKEYRRVAQEAQN